MAMDDLSALPRVTARIASKTGLTGQRYLSTRLALDTQVWP